MPVWGRKPGAATAADSAFARSLFAPSTTPPGSAFVPSSRLGRERLRTYRVLAAARVVMSLMLLGWLVLLPMTQAGPHVERPVIATLGHGVALLYLGLTAASLWWSFIHTQGLAWQVLMAIAVDLLAFTTLQFTAGYPAREFALIYALPVLAAGIYGTLSLTLFVAALVTLILLGSAGFALLGGAEQAEQRMLNAAFVGIAYFAVAVLTWQLSQRLARQEARAAASESIARRQMALNQRVIEAQRDGVMVVDRHMVLEALNPAAQHLLDLPWSDAVTARWLGGRKALRDLPVAEVVRKEVERMAIDGEDEKEVKVRTPAGRKLRLRLSRLDNLPGGVGYLIVLQDLREIEARIQQEKLAAMGRLVASVAHEIRNPLGAISQANQLAREYGADPVQVDRLHHLIAQNVERINRTVEDVLELGRSAPRDIGLMPCAPLMRELHAEFDQPDEGRIGLFIQDDTAQIRFDALHLRRVLVNLLSNARRYASKQPRAIEMRQLGVGQVREIQVSNDGPLIDAELRAQLFEPFRTTSSRGVGLGLYISHELCQRNGARLLYRIEREGTPQQRGSFVIQLAPGPEV
ncbi:MAG: histidine kinase dimerization/phospho-acceptor domain-containing protein [Thiomonas sp.]|uniref:sensor histidine kinase n=1 Tax=Thiomonas sp. TaxID=2047785 RepID=UPI002A35873A|nr:ATP-binding protein [Thiomonas sp.]MDY0330535.1 histidine kinase dimerization/phospho-acceptor domain-containing protein [Thiomonas sp.]